MPNLQPTTASHLGKDERGGYFVETKVTHHTGDSRTIRQRFSTKAAARFYLSKRHSIEAFANNPPPLQ